MDFGLWDFAHRDYVLWDYVLDSSFMQNDADCTNINFYLLAFTAFYAQGLGTAVVWRVTISQHLLYIAL